MVVTFIDGMECWGVDVGSLSAGGNIVSFRT